MVAFSCKQSLFTRKARLEDNWIGHGNYATVDLRGKGELGGEETS